MQSQKTFFVITICVCFASAVDRPGLSVGGRFCLRDSAPLSIRTSSAGHLQGIAPSRLVSVAKGRGRLCITAGSLLCIYR